MLSLEAADLDVIDGLYDVILCQELLEHLPNAEEVLKALARHLAPTGRMVITVPTRRSERWLKRINRAYMRNEPHGHVREFDEAAMRELLDSCDLTPRVFVPTQPHYFIYHTWVFGTRMRVECSTGKMLTGGFRHSFGLKLLARSKSFFLRTGWERWGRWLPRNYFIVARHKHETGD